MAETIAVSASQLRTLSALMKAGADKKYVEVAKEQRPDLAALLKDHPEALEVKTVAAPRGATITHAKLKLPLETFVPKPRGQAGTPGAPRPKRTPAAPASTRTDALTIDALKRFIADLEAAVTEKEGPATQAATAEVEEWKKKLAAAKTDDEQESAFRELGRAMQAKKDARKIALQDVLKGYKKRSYTDPISPVVEAMLA